MTRTSVGILRGGTSSEYNLSLKTGATMLSALPQDAYDTRDILIDRSGMWHLRGKPTAPARALSQIDVVLNALHGGIGEDGTVQRMLDRAGVRYAGSRAFASGLSLNKIRAREYFRKNGLRMPRGISFSVENPMDTKEMAEAVFTAFGPPYMVKPPNEGSSRGIRYVATILELPEALADILDAFGNALVEEYVRGEHATVGVIEGYRGEELYALPAAHHVLVKGERHTSFGAHEDGSAMHRVPSAFSHEAKQMLSDVARVAHRALALSHYSDADFVLTRSGPYLLEVNATPHLYEGAAFPRMLQSVGSSTREFLEHAIGLARQ